MADASSFRPVPLAQCGHAPSCPQGTSTGDLVEDDAVHATDDRGYVIIDVGR